MVNDRLQRGSGGFLSADASVAMGILVLVLMPLTLTIFPQQKLARACYEQAVVMEVLDGELEVLRAGAWRAYGAGTHPYWVKAEAVESLPAGEFVLTVGEGWLRLAWKPEATPVRKRAAQVREVSLP